MGEFELAKLIQFNEKQEAQAILDYTELLNKLNEMEVEDSIKTTVVDIISEIIADELNHQTLLHDLYEAITGINAKKE